MLDGLLLASVSATAGNQQSISGDWLWMTEVADARAHGAAFGPDGTTASDLSTMLGRAVPYPFLRRCLTEASCLEGVGRRPRKAPSAHYIHRGPTLKSAATPTGATGNLRTHRVDQNDKHGVHKCLNI